MYRVKVIIKTRDPQRPNARFSPLQHNGVFIEKPDSKIGAQDIRDKIRAEILNQIEPKNPGLEFTVSVLLDEMNINFVIKE
jgi:hypothetical protein